MQIYECNNGENRNRDEIVGRLHISWMHCSGWIGKLYRGTIAACLAALVSTCGAPEPDGQVLAVVNGDAITQAELRNAYDLAGSEEGSRIAANAGLAELVDLRLLSEAARERGAERTASYHFARRRAEERLLIEALEQMLADDAREPSEAEIDAFISDNPLSFGSRKALALQSAASGEVQWIDTAQVALDPDAFKEMSVGSEVEFAEETWSIVSIRPVETSAATQRKLAKTRLREQSAREEIARILVEARAASDVQYKSGWGPGAR